MGADLLKVNIVNAVVGIAMTIAVMHNRRKNEDKYGCCRCFEQIR